MAMINHFLVHLKAITAIVIVKHLRFLLIITAKVVIMHPHFHLEIIMKHHSDSIRGHNGHQIEAIIALNHSGKIVWPTTIAKKLQMNTIVIS